ncbi:MAG: hypothetical protein D8M58_03715 [Calditrichaeota bacterium]|nr:MAG: hypothetical protein DWQ03_03360 [Calditrichota bacterium]MBL1204474.1 hypothetical protein [Calditrichota bacterium]NOG44303.1 hypothetical protein [Calditrichota bacterium]
MDTQSLFGKSPKPDAKTKSKLIACGNEYDDLPMTYGLKQSKNQLRFGSSKERFEWISQGAVDIGFISSADFPKLKGGWTVFPGICKSSLGKSNLNLFFNKDLSDINTLAIPPNSNTSSIVLQILLKELFQIETKIEKSSLGLESALKKYDAVLLTGNNAIKEVAKNKNKSFIDLGEDWFDLTGLPLVYGFWIGNELLVNKKDYLQISESLKSGKNSIKSIVNNISGFDNKPHLENYLSNIIKYDFGEDEKEALGEFYNYAFFYGFVDYIPDFNFLEV